MDPAELLSRRTDAWLGSLPSPLASSCMQQLYMTAAFSSQPLSMRFIDPEMINPIQCLTSMSGNSNKQPLTLPKLQNENLRLPLSYSSPANNRTSNATCMTSTALSSPPVSLPVPPGFYAPSSYYYPPTMYSPPSPQHQYHHHPVHNTMMSFGCPPTTSPTTPQTWLYSSYAPTVTQSKRSPTKKSPPLSSNNASKIAVSSVSSPLAARPPNQRYSPTPKRSPPASATKKAKTVYKSRGSSPPFSTKKAKMPIKSSVSLPPSSAKTAKTPSKESSVPSSYEFRGVTMRPSGKWQAQLHYAGKSRYIGVFDSREKAKLGFEIAREVLKRNNKGSGSRNTANNAKVDVYQAEQNFIAARQAAYDGINQVFGCNEVLTINKSHG